MSNLTLNPFLEIDAGTRRDASDGPIKAAIGLFVVLTIAFSGTGVAALLRDSAAQAMVAFQQPIAQREPEIFVPPPSPFVRALDEQVLGVAFSPDGKKLVTAGARPKQPGQLKVWNVETGDELVAVKGVPGIRSVAFSSDGKTIATGDFGGAIRLRNADTGAEFAMVQAHKIGVNSVAFSADGTMLVSAGLDRIVKHWDVDGLKERKAFTGHTDMVFTAAFFRNGNAFVTGGQDATAIIWDIQDGKEKFVLRGHQGAVETVAVSPDDKVIATASWDQTIKLWNADTGKEIGMLEGHASAVYAVAFSPTDNLLASANADGSVHLWDLKTKERLATLGKHGSSAWSLAFSRDGKRLASGSSDKTAIIWDVAARKQVRTLETSERKPVQALAYAPNGNTVAIGMTDKTLQIRDARTGGLVHNLKGHEKMVTCVAFAPDGKTMASGSLDETLKLWNPATGKEIQIAARHTGGVLALAFSPDSKLLASGGRDKTIRVWDAVSGEKITEFEGHEAAVRSLAFAPHGLPALASGADDTTLRLWYLDKLLNPITIASHDGPVRVVAFGGTRLASASDDGTVKIWESSEGKFWRPNLEKEPRVLKGHTGEVSTLAFARGGLTLVSAGQDAMIIQWDPATGARLNTLQGHLLPVTALALHPQGLDLLSGSHDATVLRWQSASARAANPPEKKKLVPAKDPGAILKTKPPSHKAAYAKEYYHSFKGDQELGPEFHWHGLDPQGVVVFEPPGLRITLPPGHPGKRMGTGIGINSPVKGDFEITMRYEMINEPDPANAGEGNSMFFWVDLDKPDMNRGFISRGIGPGKRFVTWYHLSGDGNGKPIDVLRAYPAKEASGWLRLVRTGSVLYHYVAEGDRAEFTLLQQHPFGAEDLQSIRWGGQTGGANAALEGRFIDVRIRADSLPELPTKGPGADPQQAATPPVAEGSNAGSLAAGLGIGLAVLVLLALGPVLILYLRRRRPAQSAAPKAEIQSAGTPTSVSFSCPECGKHVKARSGLAGRKVRCPNCSEPVQVPEPDAGENK